MIDSFADLAYRLPAVLIALAWHEYGHARVAVWLGDNTPRWQGRLTLNPLAHIDWLGMLMLLIFKFGWAKPVPVDPRNFRNFRQGWVMVSAAGPLANVILAVISKILIIAFFLAGWEEMRFMNVLGLLYQYNLILAVFNIIPIPPLDGSKIVEGFLPYRYIYNLERLAPYGPFILLGLVYLGVIGYIMGPLIGILNAVISFVVGGVFHVF
ncbi:MAG: site-2 protease family protein [Negativicutes bacterium]|nr:site-2 protease family protein [Negativicutes bacterium]